MHYQETESRLNQNAEFTVFLPYNKTHCSINQQPRLISMGVAGISRHIKSNILNKNLCLIWLLLFLYLSLISTYHAYVQGCV